MRILVSGLLNVETTVPVRGFPINYYPIDYPFFGINSNVSTKSEKYTCFNCAL